MIYLIFNEGYAATAGEHWMRPDLCQEAPRLGRILAQLCQTSPPGGVTIQVYRPTGRPQYVT